MSLAIACCLAFQGCAVREIRQAQDDDARRASDLIATGAAVHDAVQFYDSAWLMGESVSVSKPEPAIYSKPVVYNYPARTIDDFARWMTQATGVRVVVDASASDTKSASTSFPAAYSVGKSGLPPLPPGIPGQSAGVALMPTSIVMPNTSSTGVDASGRSRYEGTLGGLLKQQDARFGVWDKYQDGVITLFRTETRVFPLPALSDSSELHSTVTTSSGDDGGSSSSGSSGGAGGNTQKSIVTAIVEPKKNLQATATAIAQGGKVVADSDLGVLIVTGTPPQCDAVEDFVKSLNATYGKVIAIDVRLYSVELTRGENYGLNIALAYKSATGHTSVGITGAAAPSISSGGTGLSFGANILSGPFSGSQGAVKLLSSLGTITNVISLGGATTNGKKTMIQNGEKQGYLPSTQSTLAANVGSLSSSQASFFTTGFTGQFLPKLTNGAIAMDMTLTLNRLVGMDTLPAGCTGSSCLQTPHTKNYDLQSFVPLKSGESLLLVGMQQDGISTTNNGVGTPFMAALGGGVDASQQHTLLAIAVTARVQ